MLGLEISQPRAPGQEAAALLENSLVEVMTMLAWIPIWGVALGLLLIVGEMMPKWDAFKAHVAALLFVPLVFAVAGFLLHMARAIAALGAGQRLAFSGKSAGVGARAILQLTTPTPWVLLFQLIAGLVVGALLWSQAPTT